MNNLTPIENRAGILVKRDDLYLPFGAGEVNGGKLRQCMMLVSAALKQDASIKGVITYCSIHSPQGPITAATARYYGLPCIVAYGGTNQYTIATEAMPRLAASYGARCRNVAQSGRHNVLKAKATEIATQEGYFVVEYGINLDSYGDVLLGAVADQVQNIPDRLERLYITCGSGITASGVIVGLEKYRKQVDEVHLISTAYDRQNRVNGMLDRYGVHRDYIYHDMFHEPGFHYEKGQNLRLGGIKLHPQYEAKSYKYIIDNKLPTNNSLFWIVGAEPNKK